MKRFRGKGATASAKCLPYSTSFFVAEVEVDLLLDRQAMAIPAGTYTAL